MLVLTKAAAQVVKSVTSVQQLSDGSGLRITSTAQAAETGSTLQVAAAPVPGEYDHVIEESGARVFVEPQAAAYLDDKVLDAQVDEQGQAHFSLSVQQPRQL